MKIKIFALVLVLALTAGMLVGLVGCKPDDEPPAPGPVVGGGDDDDNIDTSHYDDIFWTEEDTFIFSLTENSNFQELPSTCARYLAGDTDRGLPVGELADTIDDMVDIRNSKATEYTRVSPRYTYIEDDNKHGWGMNINDMIYDMSNFIPNTTPDVYCNFVYDMLCASLSGAFANLKTTTLYTDGQAGNWFRFVDPQYKDTGTGYMVEYMRSLSLSRNKQYCLSSDYFTDMVRAFFAVPVNINLLQTIPLSEVEGAFNYDYDGDGFYTIEDFYSFVYTGQWSYQTLAEISAMNFYQDNPDGQNTGDPNGDLHDRLIFAISESSGLSSSGLLYTTSVTIIRRELTTLVDGNGVEYTDYIYDYPDTNADLYAFCDSLTSLMGENKGIISITNDQNCGYYTGDNAAMLAIRDRFINNRVLFGGDICLGSLEYNEYREMTDGFGIVPVPLFRTENSEGAPEKYMTQIHNIGRIGGINAKTQKFAKISAYLDYQSLASTEILEEYYNFKLCQDVAGGGSHREMLIYIRSNVRTSFDKAFEDAIGRLFANEGGGQQGEGTSSEQQKWHAILMAHHFEYDSGAMAGDYESYIGSKDTRLQSLENSYVGLPS